MTLATPAATIKQMWHNSIRYCNANSAFACSAMVNSSKMQDLPLKFSDVVMCVPANAADRLFMDNPLFSTLGVILLDNVTSDLIQITESFKAYRNYVQTDFQWFTISSRDPKVATKLLMNQLNARITRCFVMGMQRFATDEDVTGDNELDWMLRYTKAQVNWSEGNAIRKAGMIGINNDGDSLCGTGSEEMKALREELIVKGRWVAAIERG